MYPCSIRLTDPNQKFLDQYSSRNKTPKSALINKALDLFRKYWLQKELQGMAKANEKEDRTLAEVDMRDYLKLIDGA